MALEPGGYADKLGNRYEGRWVARQLLFLLAERISSLTLESVGDDEAGVDLWIKRLDGALEAQQCKAENGTKSNWSLKDLKSRGVLSRLRAQLQRNSCHRFRFVSSTPANQLRDLSRSATDSTGDPDSFYKNQIQAGSEDRRKSFTGFCECLGLDEKRADDRAIAFNLLLRTDFHLFSDDREQREDLKWMASQSVVGDGNAVIAILADFAQENLRKTVIASDVRKHLRKLGFEPRALLADERIEPKLEELRTEFQNSIGDHLAGGELIPRAEFDQLKTILSGDVDVDAVVLHGAAGKGKSGILYQLCQHLDKLNTPYLPVRLDRKVPQSNPNEFGKKLGLPDSPVNSLCAVSGDRHCVLLLDQLDALRWTSAHATEGIDVCKALLREIRASKRLGKRISIVFCCRTFDLEHDPQIKTWLKESQSFRLLKVQVSDLPEKAVEEFVTRFKVDYKRMTSRCKSLLQSVQNLALWAEVVESEENSPEFDSVSDLLRSFFRSRHQELEKAGFPSLETKNLFDTITEYMEMNASLSAPRRIAEPHQRLMTELQTLNVIHVDRHTVSFCHQSLLDFLVASRALDAISAGDRSIIDWIGSKARQTLFRREQLRQLLYLLADENIPKLSRSLKLLIASEEVRFHIKQLTVETIGQLHPFNEVQAFVFSLLETDDWRDNVLRDVFYRNRVWIEAMHEEGRLVTMLLSDDPAEYGVAVWLLGSVVNQIPDVVRSALNAAEKAKIKDRLFNLLLFSEPESEINQLFRFRLSTLATEVEPPYVSWEKLARARPDRAIRLFDAILKCSKDNTRVAYQRDIIHGGDFNVICSAASRVPRLTVRLLKPIIIRHASQKITEQRAWKNRADGENDIQYPSTQYPKGLLAAFRAAIVSLAKRHPNEFIKLNSQLEKLKSRGVQAILCRGWAAMPVKQYADKAMNWLLARKYRLRCGSERQRPRWCIAADLIKAMSPHCSFAVFNRLEAKLLRYRDPEEKRLAAYWLRYAREGYYRDRFGAAGYFLLPALDQTRLCDETIGRIGVLERKFADYPRESFLRSRGRGALVRSPLGTSAIARMSNKQWSRLIANRDVPPRDGVMRGRRYSNNGFTESSVEMFARDFGTAAKREPERFGRLALKLSSNAPPDYFAELLSALGELQPPNDVLEEFREAWQPASPELIHEVLKTIPLSNANHLLRRFCWLVLSRTDLDPSDRMVRELIELTYYIDPHYEVADDSENNYDPQNDFIHELETIALNHVRALAVAAIGSMLFENANLFPRFEPALAERLNDSHPAVRLAMVGVCLPIWNFNRPLAVEWFLKIVSPDLWPACGEKAQRFLNCAFPQFTEKLTPLIESMVNSDHPRISQEGSEEVMARWLFHGVFEELSNICRGGSIPQRKGAARIAAQFAKNEKYANKCLPILAALCDDPNEEIREEVIRAFYKERFLETPNVTSFLLTFLQSAAFDDDPDSLCRALYDFPGSLVEFSEIAFAAVKQAIKIQHDSSKKRRRMGMLDVHLSGIVLRLYEQSNSEKNLPIREECLDAIDNMLKHRVAPARTLLDEIAK